MSDKKVEVKISFIEALETYYTMRHAKTFIASKEKMHPMGIELYEKVLSRLKEKIEEKNKKEIE